jgi:hypothetical protein
MDRADMVNALRELCRVKDLKDSKSTSLVRMRELGVKVSMARHEKYTRNMRGLTSQHRTGTIS